MKPSRCHLPFYSLLFLCCSCSPSSFPEGEIERIENYTECILVDGQDESSLYGYWEKLPVPLLLDENFYLTNEGDQAKEIKHAVDTWNAWSNLKGFKAFEIVNDGAGLGAGAPFPTINSCLQAEITNAERSSVGIWKIESSGHSGNTRQVGSGTCQIIAENIYGITDWLFSGETIIGGSIILNYDHWNISGRPSVDIQTTALHELGHILGLLHSCVISEGDISTAPPCDSPDTPRRFINALMSSSIASSETRRSLKQNDYDRVNCLY